MRNGFSYILCVKNKYKKYFYMKHYVYIILDPRKTGVWSYKEHTFGYEPIYVGIGQKSRMIHHWWVYIKSSTEYLNPILKLKFDKIKILGLKPVTQKIYQSLTKDDACKIEVDIVAHFGKIKDKNGGILTNIGNGGEYQKIGPVIAQCKKVIKFDLEGSKMAEYESVNAAQRAYNKKDKGNISRCVNGKCVTAYGFIYRFKGSIEEESIDTSYLKNHKGNVGKREIEVFAYDTNGYLYKEYESFISAAQDMGINENMPRHASINNSYNHGFIWSRMKHDRIELSDANKKDIMFYETPIFELKNGKFKIFKSMVECARYNNTSIYHVNTVVKGDKDSWNGFKWSLHP